jgi:hypothetical protein
MASTSFNFGNSALFGEIKVQNQNTSPTKKHKSTGLELNERPGDYGEIELTENSVQSWHQSVDAVTFSKCDEGTDGGRRSAILSRSTDNPGVHIGTCLKQTTQHWRNDYYSMYCRLSTRLCPVQLCSCIGCEHNSGRPFEFTSFRLSHPSVSSWSFGLLTLI